MKKRLVPIISGRHSPIGLCSSVFGRARGLPCSLFEGRASLSGLFEEVSRDVRGEASGRELRKLDRWPGAVRRPLCSPFGKSPMLGLSSATAPSKSRDPPPRPPFLPHRLYFLTAPMAATAARRGHRHRANRSAATVFEFASMMSSLQASHLLRTFLGSSPTLREESAPEARGSRRCPLLMRNHPHCANCSFNTSTSRFPFFLLATSPPRLRSAARESPAPHGTIAPVSSAPTETAGQLSVGQA
jgi:hypothetical protein